MFYSDEIDMQIPHPHEFPNLITHLLNKVDPLSTLGMLSSDLRESEFKKAIQLPAPLYYRFDIQQWWSIYSKSQYNEFIPWHRQFKSSPSFPVLNDNLIFCFRKWVKITSQSFVKRLHF